MDEIQKIPALLDEVHRQIEIKKRIFILTGSSTRKLKRADANLLAGRALRLEMHPLSASLELKGRFDLRRALEVGLLPEPYLEPEITSAKRFLKTYVATYLKEEVLQEGLVRRPDHFARFLEAASFSQGSVLSLSSVAQEAAIGRKAAEGFFGILEDLLLARQIPVFSRRAKRKLISHRKFYFFDSGVFNAIRPRGPLDVASEITGVSLETLVMQELIAVNSCLELDYKLYFWRTQSNLEVDFIWYGPAGFHAIEVKASSRLRPADFASLEIFGKDYPEASRWLISNT